MRITFEIPPAPRMGDMTDEEYESFAEGWEYDTMRDVVCAAEDAGGKLVGGGP